MNTKQTKTAFKADFLQKIKEMLIIEKKRIEDELSKFAKKKPDVADDYDSNFPDYGSKDDENAAEVADYVVSLSLEDSLEHALHDVSSALARLADGSYGICKYCKKVIEEKRLLARPQSSACMECKKIIKQEV